MSLVNPDFSVTELEALFWERLGQLWHTRLVGGAHEPLYTPPRGAEPALIRYAHDYFRSALHEIAHWCIAGPERRLQQDYGYWYAPDGRSPGDQALFLQVEEKPQALEWLFCAACGHDFCVSLDNLDGGGGADVADFEARVRARALNWLEQGSMPERARRWIDALAEHYQTPPGLAPDRLDRVFKPLPS